MNSHQKALIQDHLLQLKELIDLKNYELILETVILSKS